MSESKFATWLLIKSKWITFIVKCLKHIFKGAGVLSAYNFEYLHSQCFLLR